MKARFSTYILHFKFAAGTSRGVLLQKPTRFLILGENNIQGIGECSTIAGLSIDPEELIEQKLENLCAHINNGNNPLSFDLSGFPAIKFSLETALIDLKSGGNSILYPTKFTEGHHSIPINGLVWMGDIEFMANQIREKIDAGYRCIKIKIGALDFETEFDLIKKIRTQYGPNDIEIRLDANGGFSPEDALKKLEKLSLLSIHSVEQPVKSGQLEKMSEICRNSPIPIALDEELIGLNPDKDSGILDILKPSYIILKPSLVGGFKPAEKWIAEAEKRDTGWWITSALEANIGLNAIAQWTATKDVIIPQGLGTGQLYHNNILSPLEIKKAALFYNPEKNWNTDAII